MRGNVCEELVTSPSELFDIIPLPPPRHNHEKTHSGGGVDVEDLPMSDERSAVMNYATEHRDHLHTDEPSSGTGGHSVFSWNRKESPG